LYFWFAKIIAPKKLQRLLCWSQINIGKGVTVNRTDNQIHVPRLDERKVLPGNKRERWVKIEFRFSWWI